MTSQILRATPVAGRVALKLQTVCQQFLKALDAFAEAKIRNAVPQRELHREKREINGCRQLEHADQSLPGAGRSGRTSAMLGQFQQRNEQQEVLDQEATLMPSDVETVQSGNIGHTLDLSASRAYDSALEILGACKLTGNFHVDLEILLKDMDALDKVTFEVQPESHLTYFTDCRHVLFRPNETVHTGQFSEIIRSIKDRLGFDGTRPWWSRVFH